MISQKSKSHSMGKSTLVYGATITSRLPHTKQHWHSSYALYLLVFCLYTEKVWWDLPKLHPVVYLILDISYSAHTSSAISSHIIFNIMNCYDIQVQRVRCHSIGCESAWNRCYFELQWQHLVLNLNKMIFQKGWNLAVLTRPPRSHFKDGVVLYMCHYTLLFPSV